MAKKTETKEVLERIWDYTLEDIMGERFGSYSKYIIQERAIPDARDGLKPVQRRILYSMYKEKNTYDKGYRKSAKTVGDVIGNYHPHGDTSIYDAMVRMSQSWKTRLPYIDMHGNNGSIDGDSPAAYRYTEARLSKISNEMLRDINKDTVEMAPNFDDTTLEPTVLPARFPALLVYGAMGISAGYATNIPPHNLGEVIDATIHRIDNPNCGLDTLMKYVKGPDFPTGGIVEGIKGIRDAYETGKGRVIIRSKYAFEGNSLVITEIPFEVNKELIVNYLLKNTDLQISYNFNMIAIVKKRPRLLGLKGALDAFIDHQKEVITRRSQFDLDHAKSELHIVEGLIKCLSILDEVIRVIRASKNKADAKENLVKEFDFSMAQAEAIVTLQLYRLTNTDVVELEERLATLRKIIDGLTAILGNEEVLKKVMKDELRKVRNEYALPRLTEIKDEITEIKIDTTVMIPKEDVIVTLSRDGYIKRTSLKSYSASNDEETTLKENDYLIGLYEASTLDTLLVFTNLGNFLFIPVYTIYDLKWKELGKHVSNLVPLGEGEEVVSCLLVKDFDDKANVIIATGAGMIKRTPVHDFKITRTSKPSSCIKLKDSDRVVDVMLDSNEEIFVATSLGYGLWFSKEEIPIVGIKASGVKAINLKDDTVVSVINFNVDANEYLAIITDKGTGKRVKLKDFEKSSRARRGLMIIRDVKTNPYYVIKVLMPINKDHIGIKNGDITLIKPTELPIADRYSTGSTINKKGLTNAFLYKTLEKPMEKEDNIPKKDQVSLEDIDKRLMTIDDFLK